MWWWPHSQRYFTLAWNSIPRSHELQQINEQRTNLKSQAPRWDSIISLMSFPPSIKHWIKCSWLCCVISNIPFLPAPEPLSHENRKDNSGVRKESCPSWTQLTDSSVLFESFICSRAKKEPWQTLSAAEYTLLHAKKCTEWKQAVNTWSRRVCIIKNTCLAFRSSYKLVPTCSLWWFCLGELDLCLIWEVRYKSPPSAPDESRLERGDHKSEESGLGCIQQAIRATSIGAVWLVAKSQQSRDLTATPPSPLLRISSTSTAFFRPS